MHTSNCIMIPGRQQHMNLRASTGRRGPEPVHELALTLVMKLSFLNYLSPTLFSRLRFRAKMGAWPNLRNPVKFDEKLLWLMLYWRHPLKTVCGDKYTMRSYVAAKRLGHLLPDLVGVYENSREIDYSKMPRGFILKCTHGCGLNIVCRPGDSIDVDRINRRLDRWMAKDFGRLYGELHYSKMKPRIIAERLLAQKGLAAPIDYKVYCFDGRPHCTMVCTDRGSMGGTKYFFYDREWKSQLPYSRSSLASRKRIAKPAAYDRMIAAAEKLSEGFPFVRVDFYSIGGRAYVGEMTFTPAGCMDSDYTHEAQKELGALLVLPRKMLQ